MGLLIIKIVLASSVIAFCSWLSGKYPQLAGFMVALPITTLIVLAFSHIEWNNPANSFKFAKSIFVGIPVSLLFFVPFLFAQKFNLGFWNCYSSGFILLIIGFFIHRYIFTALL